MWPDELGIELANVHGGAVDRPAVGRPTPTEMGVVSELHGANVVLVRSRSEREGGWRGEVHGAAHSGELSRNSDERFTRRGGLPRAVEVSAGCARGRRSLGQDGAARGELAWSERQRRRWRAVSVVEPPLLLLFA
jgi:hypothetical protein